MPGLTAMTKTIPGIHKLTAKPGSQTDKTGNCLTAGWVQAKDQFTGWLTAPILKGEVGGGVISKRSPEIQSAKSFEP